jgi:hypothetical protein
MTGGTPWPEVTTWAFKGVSISDRPTSACWSFSRLTWPDGARALHRSHTDPQLIAIPPTT